MGKSQNPSLLFYCCFVLFGLIMFVEAQKPLILPQSVRCPENEFFTDCGGPCQTECSTLGEPCLIRNIRCPEGCYCSEGYARDSSGKCIPQENCPYY